MDWNPELYAEKARFVSDLGMPVVELLSPQSDERILDLGCGDGALTKEITQRCRQTVGVDSSPEMITAAKALGLNAQVMDGQSLQFVDEFDAVFSNAVLHWMKKPERVIAGVWRALKPGGRFVGEFGGHGNVSSIVTALETALSTRGLAANNPWFFPHPEEYQTLLESAGFVVESTELFSRPTALPGDVGGWLKTFAQPYTSALPKPQKNKLIAEVTQMLSKVLVDENGVWQADYVRLRFSARRPAGER